MLPHRKNPWTVALSVFLFLGDFVCLSDFVCLVGFVCLSPINRCFPSQHRCLKMAFSPMSAMAAKKIGVSRQQGCC
jgi:hypothetical protein